MSGWALHNAKLVGTSADDVGNEILIIERNDRLERVLTGRRSNHAGGHPYLGQRGYVYRTLSCVAFIPYMDATLERDPDLDCYTGSHRRTVEHGWRCSSRPDGFLAPAGIVPGIDGKFVPDETVPVTLNVPPEFVRKAAEYQLEPERLLRLFIGDVCGLHNMFACPRADGYGSQGSDERDLAEEWLERGLGSWRIDIDAREQREERARTEEENLEVAVADLRDTCADHDELMGVIDQLIRSRQATQKATP